MVSIENISKSFSVPRNSRLFHRIIDHKMILKDISLQIESGTIFGLIGPNGAGKTTLIKILSTLILPDSGRILVDNIDVVKNCNEVRKIIGVSLTGERSLYWKLSARENLQYFAALYGLDKKESEKHIDQLLDYMNLSEKQHDRIESYSTGMRQKIILSRALLPMPKLLILDEPTTGLDPASANELRTLIKTINSENGITILLTSHNMHEVEELCDKTAIINHGKIVAIGKTVELIKSVSNEKKYVFKLKGSAKKIIQDQVMKNCEITKMTFETEDSDSILTLSSAKEDLLEKIIPEIKLLGYMILDINVVSPSLENVFIQMTGSSFKEIEEI
jgi:ABC-2 type transport system ATP-binding protein